MKPILSLICVTLLSGCAGKIISTESPPVDTGPEVLRIIVPPGSKVAYQSTRPGIQIVEYIPENQTIEHWSEMITVLIMARDIAPDINSFFDRMTNTFHAGCTVEADVRPPIRFKDGDYSAGTQTSICGKGKQFGTGAIVTYKMIEGGHGFYQVQRAWNFAPVAKSADLKFTDEMRASADETLNGMHLCNKERSGGQC